MASGALVVFHVTLRPELSAQNVLVFISLCCHLT